MMKYAGNLMRVLFFTLFLFLLAKEKVFLWLLLFAASLFIALVWGSVYCGYVCPINTVMILAERLSKKLGLQTSGEPACLKKDYWGWVFLLLSVAGMVGAKRFFDLQLPVLPLWLLISVLVTLRYKPAVFHNKICPFGVLQRLFGRFALISERVDQNACVGCGLCEDVCPSKAIVVYAQDQKAKIDKSLCHQCTNCQQICPVKAIHYRKALD